MIEVLSYISSFRCSFIATRNGAVSLIREMGPVITALICTGKFGSGMGAELGSMKVTEQID
jgi:ABC-type transporter Mla maintaining outer membrane lipid asymmetry permease subunit MlaE